MKGGARGPIYGSPRRDLLPTPAGVIILAAVGRPVSVCTYRLIATDGPSAGRRARLLAQRSFSRAAVGSVARPTR